ncbi:DNA-binding transcriptional regulator, LysR family [Sphingobium sp. AP50]|uniref:LysR family transcriptional regulator n=1 Tax=Sphingobium sp. AP50 TaxID=1884369 RepID=UPI0008C3417D|nr:LysR family transcriptional regulator [Sphingobium sp. AP50]SEJ56446.1 DNA-binding transcriptional regulator, LysR family [Sphingobium sp. AP50]
MLDRDPFSGVTVFVTAARAGSFTLAAERLGLTKSSVGKTIARLEDRLGFRLFNRTTRLMRLTADGEAYLAACSVAIDEVTSVQSALSSSNRILSGRVHIDMPIVFGRKVLLPILMAITRPHPDLSLSLTFTDATSDLLRDDVDLAIRFGTLSDNSNLIARRLTSQRRVICASPDYLKMWGKPKALDDIRSHRCIVGAHRGPPLTWLVREGSVERRLVPPATHQISDGEAMVDATVGGLGLAQVPISMVRADIDAGRLQTVLDEFSSVDVDIHAVWPRQAQLSPRVRFIVDQLVNFAADGQLD